MSKLENELKKFKTRQNVKDEQKTYNQEWPRCSANGCRLMSSYKNGSPVCSFHAGQEAINWPSITDAIIEKKAYINKYASLIHASSSYWSDPMRIAAMKGWPVLPMSEGEPISTYLTRFNHWLHQEIKIAANERRKR